MDLSSYLYVPWLVLLVVALVAAIREQWPAAKTIVLVVASLVLGVAASFVFTDGHRAIELVRAGIAYGAIAAGGMHVLNFSATKLGAAQGEAAGAVIGSLVGPYPSDAGPAVDEPKPPEKPPAKAPS